MSGRQMPSPGPGFRSSDSIKPHWWCRIPASRCLMKGCWRHRSLVTSWYFPLFLPQPKPCLPCLFNSPLVTCNQPSIGSVSNRVCQRKSSLVRNRNNKNKVKNWPQQLQHKSLWGNIQLDELDVVRNQRQQSTHFNCAGNKPRQGNRRWMDWENWEWWAGRRRTFWVMQSSGGRKDALHIWPSGVCKRTWRWEVASNCS